MAVYSVHVPGVPSGSSQLDAERVKFVADKFTWPAMFFGVFWLVWHRMWWVLAGFIVIILLAPFVAQFTGISDVTTFLIVVAAVLLFANEAASLRRWSLARQGYRMVAILSARDTEECERKFFAEWTPSTASTPGTDISSTISGEKKVPNLNRPDSNRNEPNIIGTFPAPGVQK